MPTCSYYNIRNIRNICPALLITVCLVGVEKLRTGHFYPYRLRYFMHFLEYWMKDILCSLIALSKTTLVGVSGKHYPPSLTRDWTPNDKVHIMEVDVPCSYYGDEREYALCQTWIRGGAVRGTLWVEHSRPMESWAAYTARWSS